MSLLGPMPVTLAAKTFVTTSAVGPSTGFPLLLLHTPSLHRPTPSPLERTIDCIAVGVAHLPVGFPLLTTAPVAAPPTAEATNSITIGDRTAVDRNRRYEVDQHRAVSAD